MSSNVHDDDVRSGPDRYISELGVAKDIGRYLSDYRHPVIVSGEHSWNAFVEYADEVPEYPVFRYDGSATLRNAQELAQNHRDVAGGCHRGHRSRETFRYGEECR